MAEDAKPTPPPDGAQGGTPAGVDASAKASGTPTTPAVDAAGKGEKAPKVYDEASYKAIVEERDRAKAAAKSAGVKTLDDARKLYLESEEGKRVQALIKEKAESELAAKKKAEEEAVARGEAQKVIQERDAQIEKLKQDGDARDRQYRESAIMREFKIGFERLGGFDVNDANAVLKEAIEKNTVTVDDSGAVVGVNELLRKLTETKRHWFPSGAKDALERVIKEAPGVLRTAATTLDVREPPFDPNERPSSLAKPSRAVKRMAPVMPGVGKRE